MRSKRFDYLSKFYELLQEDNEEKIKGMNIPMDLVFYTRAAIEANVGVVLTIPQVISLLEEELGYKEEFRENGGKKEVYGCDEGSSEEWESLVHIRR